MECVLRFQWPPVLPWLHRLVGWIGLEPSGLALFAPHFRNGLAGKLMITHLFQSGLQSLCQRLESPGIAQVAECSGVAESAAIQRNAVNLDPGLRTRASPGRSTPNWSTGPICKTRLT